MVKRKIIEAVEFLKEYLIKKGLNISQVILFGSQTRGIAEEGSDIDIIIISDDFKGKDIFERAELIKEGEIFTLRKFMIPLDVITVTPEEYKQGIPLIVEYVKKNKDTLVFSSK